ncbi:glycosyltransferase [Micromonospora sp. B11E3]|uniref:glycosyltransferase n=1 Tax=Micromonospora sp. B11E3 TaxID=3153562 RepID=UPI00325D7A58
MSTGRPVQPRAPHARQPDAGSAGPVPGPAGVRESGAATAGGPPAGPGAPRRVVHVVGCLDRGGIETAALDVCRSIPPTQAHQTFVTVAGWEGTLAGDFRAAGAAVRQLPVRPRATFALRMWRCLRALRPDVVVSHISLTSALVLLMARFCGVPVRVARLWSEGDGRVETGRRRLQRTVLRRLLRHAATDVLGVTAAALDFTRPPGDDPRYRVLYNGVALDRVDGWTRRAARERWGLPADVPVLGYLGRAAPEKNRPFLVDVHRAARALRPGTRLLVAGPAGTDDLTTACPGIGADGQVVLAGEVDDIGAVLAAADVLLLPSLREGLPGVVLEALAVGVPVVSSDLACLRELAALVTGLTPVPLSAGADRWAQVALDQAATGADRRREIASSLRASPFTLAAVAGQWRALWGVAR